MDDRTLLGLAAKAFGIAIGFEGDRVYCENCTDLSWNPLTDDGDALRLAVTLYFSIKIFRPTFDEFEEPGMIEIWHDNSTDPIHVEYYDKCNGRQAATRCAITYAAAIIGANDGL